MNSIITNVWLEIQVLMIWFLFQGNNTFQTWKGVEIHASVWDADSNQNFLPVANGRFTSYMMTNISDRFSNVCFYVIIISLIEISVSGIICSSFFSCSVCPILSTVTLCFCILSIMPYKNKGLVLEMSPSHCLLHIVFKMSLKIPSADNLLFHIIFTNKFCPNPLPGHSMLPLTSYIQYFLILSSATDVMKTSEVPLLRNGMNTEESAHCL